MSDLWHWFLCDTCGRCDPQCGCVLGLDADGWKVINETQDPRDVCAGYEEVVDG